MSPPVWGSVKPLGVLASSLPYECVLWSAFDTEGSSNGFWARELRRAASAHVPNPSLPSRRTGSLRQVSVDRGQRRLTHGGRSEKADREMSAKETLGRCSSPSALLSFDLHAVRRQAHLSTFARPALRPGRIGELGGRKPLVGLTETVSGSASTPGCTPRCLRRQEHVPALQADEQKHLDLAAHA